METQHVSAQTLNSLFAEKVEKPENLEHLAQVCSVFVGDRLRERYDQAGERPQVTCELTYGEGNIRWRFEIQFKGQEKKMLYVDLEKDSLLAEKNPITYVLEKAVKSYLFPEEREAAKTAWKTPIG